MPRDFKDAVIAKERKIAKRQRKDNAVGKKEARQAKFKKIAEIWREVLSNHGWKPTDAKKGSRNYAVARREYDHIVAAEEGGGINWTGGLKLRKKN